MVPSNLIENRADKMMSITNPNTPPFMYSLLNKVSSDKTIPLCIIPPIASSQFSRQKGSLLSVL